jgi:hypothetical protein
MWRLTQVGGFVCVGGGLGVCGLKLPALGHPAVHRLHHQHHHAHATTTTTTTSQRGLGAVCCRVRCSLLSGPAACSAAAEEAGAEVDVGADAGGCWTSAGCPSCEAAITDVPCNRLPPPTPPPNHPHHPHHRQPPHRPPPPLTPPPPRPVKEEACIPPTEQPPLRRRQQTSPSCAPFVRSSLM